MNKILSILLMFNLFCQSAEQINWFTIASLITVNWYLLHKTNCLEKHIKEQKNHYDHKIKALKKDVKELKGNTIDIIISPNLNPMAQPNQNNNPQQGAQFTFLLNRIISVETTMRSIRESNNEILLQYKVFSDQASFLQLPANTQSNGSNQLRSNTNIDHLETKILKTQHIMFDMLNSLTAFSEELYSRGNCQQYHRNNFEIMQKALKEQMGTPVAINVQPAFAQKKKDSSVFNIFRPNKN